MVTYLAIMTELDSVLHVVEALVALVKVYFSQVCIKIVYPRTLRLPKYRCGKQGQFQN